VSLPRCRGLRLHCAPVRRLPSILLALLGAAAPFAVHAGRPLAPEDWYRFKDVSSIRIAPDGGAVAYLVTSYDKDADESISHLWLSDWGSGESVQLTRGESVREPRFSPDGRYLSFLSARPAGSPAQLWALDRRGGEPRQISHVSGKIVSYAWSPDGKRMVLVMRAGEKTEEDEKTAHRPKPLVIGAYHFKQDGRGYLTAASRSHLWLLDVAGGGCEPLTSDPAREDSLPAFSPDGRLIAYVSNEMQGPHGAGIDEIELIAPEGHAAPRRLLSTWSPNNQRLEFSPDGTQLAFLEGDELKYNSYIMDRLAIAEVASGRARKLARGLDRAVVSPAFTAEGDAIEFAVEDDGYQYPAQVHLKDGAVERLAGPSVVDELTAAAGHTAVLAATDQLPFEVFALEKGSLRALSAHNQPLFDELTLGAVADIAFKSRDGTPVHGQIVKPPGFVPGRRYPTIVWIHGGPDGQDDHSLALRGYAPQLERQLFATHGYVALAINYRGSTGRGAKFARSILADWGHLEVEDLHAGVDWAVAQGSADPARLGVGGWSYGGLLTDYLIASDPRFKAGISGAGSGNQISTYGSDQYVVQYDAELGPPWKNTALWLKVSYPFFHADRIRTPTLFLGGSQDFNVPVGGGEQMYQALRTLGVPTELVVYPGEYHDFDRPSFLADRYQRYLDWMAKYLGAPH
jgi:dipeptidyl aminopeptidase/acylaminoacyl peptidase